MYYKSYWINFAWLYKIYQSIRSEVFIDFACQNELDNIIYYPIRRTNYSRDNRVIFFRSSNSKECLPPRCRLILSSRCKWWEGCICSMHKKVHELGSYRRKTGSPLSSDKIVELDRGQIVREGPCAWITSY